MRRNGRRNRRRLATGALRVAAVVALACSLAGFAGCQSTEPEDALASVVAGRAAPQGPEIQAVGSGPLALAMLLPLGSSGTERNLAADYRDGGALAVRDLGFKQATLTIYDTKGVPTEVARLGNLALSSGAKAIIGPTTLGDVSALVGMNINKNAVILALASDVLAGKDNIFSMMSDEADSAVAIGAYAVAAGKKELIILKPEGFPDSSLVRIKKGVEGDQGHIIGVIGYTAQAQEVAALVAKNAAAIGKADAILLLSGPDTEAVAAALRQGGFVTERRPLLGTVGWSKSAIADKNTFGALLALPDEAGLRQIAKNFTAAYGRPPSAQAAYAYDATAIVLGIARVLGPEALTGQTLVSDKGFRGTTGIFRFNKDGSIDRLLSIYVNRDGVLNRIKAAGTSF
jgi:ABC-type branched-subunit amino acid transport system substrate-binding protein